MQINGKKKKWQMWEMILLVLILTILCTLSYFYLDIKQNITLFLSPFTAFTFSGQSAYSSVFGGEAPFCFFMYCAKAPYERCVQIVWTTPGGGKHRAYDCWCAVLFSSVALHSVWPMNREIDRKRWRRWRGQKLVEWATYCSVTSRFTAGCMLLHCRLHHNRLPVAYYQ